MKSVECWVVGNEALKKKLPPEDSGRNTYVADDEDAIVVIPVTLEIVQVDIEVTVRVAVQVRHPAVTVKDPVTNVPHVFLVTKSSPCHPLNFIPSQNSLTYSTD